MGAPAETPNPTALAKSILRNEADTELILEDELVWRLFPEEMERLKKEFEKRAQEKGGEPPAFIIAPTYMKLYWLAMCLKKLKKFEYARKILNRAREYVKKEVEHQRRQKWQIKIIQQRALCTYKDTYLSPDARLDNALDILKELQDLQPVPDQETLGLKGGIYKRKWEADGNKQFLEMSLSYYYQGYKKGIADDYGYTSINAAYVLDLLANIVLEEAEVTGGPYTSATKCIRLARKIRGEIKRELDTLSKADPGLLDEWWFLTTLAEACFGRQDADCSTGAIQPYRGRGCLRLEGDDRAAG
jgi:tetratricopeptide (TPR) repeat protein